jgi:hypothetical protein
MAKSIEVEPKKRRGRPFTGGKDPIVGVRMPPEERQSIEDWAAEQSPKPTLSKAVRYLAQRGLSAARAAVPKRPGK